MKKIFIVLALISIIFSANARPVDEKLAREIGVKFLNANTTMKASVNDLQLAKTYNTDAKSAAFYIFNTSNGFVIVSADDHAYPILGYSDEGQFDVENHTQGKRIKIVISNDKNPSERCPNSSGRYPNSSGRYPKPLGICPNS